MFNIFTFISKPIQLEAIAEKATKVIKDKCKGQCCHMNIEGVSTASQYQLLTFFLYLALL